MPTRYQLPNGLTVVFEPQRHVPVAAFQVWVKAGSADETADEIGLAHLHEHMLFKGTSKRGLGEIARSVEAHGGAINAWTSFDQTVYHVVMASRHAWQGLDVLADAVRNSAFDEGELSREIEVVCEEIKRSLDMASRRASKAFFANAFRVHPYGRPVIGFEENVRAHTRERVLGFYRKHYRPTNLVLSAVGDFDEATLRAQVDALFGGDWGRAAAPPFTRPREPDFDGVRVSLVEDELKDAHLHFGFQVEGMSHPDTAALDVLAMVLGQGDASRLALEVRRKRALARDVSAWAWTPKERGLFAASITSVPETLAQALEETARVMATLTRVEAEPDEVETVKALIEAEAVYQRETVQGLARKYGSYESTAGGLEQEAAYYEAVSRVTPQRLREVAERTFTFDRAVVSGLLPRGTPLSEAQARALLAGAASEKPRSLPARVVAERTAPRPAPVARAARDGVTVETLPNGATLVVKEERAAPLFALRASFLAGTRLEGEAENGISTLLARTWTRGTTSLPPEAMSHLVDALAGSVSALAGRNSVSLRGEFLSKHFERSFDLFTDALLHPAFDEAEVTRERTQQLQDLASRDDRPASVAMELLQKTLWQVHPYRLSPLGEPAIVAALTPDALRRYHQRFLHPSRMTLAVVGDVDAARVLDRVREAFSARASTPFDAPLVAREPAWDGPRTARRVLPRQQTHLIFGFHGASMFEPWRRALEVLQTLLSGQSGRLFLELRDKRSMAYSVSAGMVEGLETGAFTVYMGTSPEKVEAAQAGIKDELLKLREALVSDAELARAKEYLIGTQSIGLQRNGARAGTMALDACYGLGAEAWRTYGPEIAAVTAEDVREAARRVIDFEKCALAVVGPAA